MSLQVDFKQHTRLLRQTAYNQHAWRSHRDRRTFRKSASQEEGAIDRLSQWILFFLLSVYCVFSIASLKFKDLSICSTAGKHREASVHVCVYVPVGEWARCRWGETVWWACSAVGGLCGLNPPEAVSHTVWPLGSLLHTHNKRWDVWGRSWGLGLSVLTLWTGTLSQMGSWTQTPSWYSARPVALPCCHYLL